MKILVVGNFGISWDGSACDELHVSTALANMGHDVTEWQREKVSEKEGYPSGNFDYILISQWNGYPLDICDYLHELYDCPIVYWAFDYQWHSREAWHLSLVKNVDIFLTKEAGRIGDYSRMAHNTSINWMPADFAPDGLTANPQKEKDIEVLFTGTYLPNSEDRTDFLRSVDKYFDLHIYSVTHQQWADEGFANVHPPVVDQAMYDVVGRSKVNISIDLFYDAGFWSDRNSQIMAAGGLVLFRHVPLSELIYHDYITYFHSIDDGMAKLSQLLAKTDEERERMAARSMEYAQKNLTAHARVHDMHVLVESML